MDQNLIATIQVSSGREDIVVEIQYDENITLSNQIKEFENAANNLFNTSNAKVRSLALTTHGKQGELILLPNGERQLVIIYEYPSNRLLERVV